MVIRFRIEVAVSSASGEKFLQRFIRSSINETSLTSVLLRSSAILFRRALLGKVSQGQIPPVQETESIHPKHTLLRYKNERLSICFDYRPFPSRECVDSMLMPAMY